MTQHGTLPQVLLQDSCNFPPLPHMCIFLIKEA